MPDFVYPYPPVTGNECMPLCEGILPVYLVFQTSYGMEGEPIEIIRIGLEALLSDLRSDSLARDKVMLSIITYDETAKELVPLTAIDRFTEPDLVASGRVSLGAGLELMLSLMNDSVIEADVGDREPLVFLFSDSLATDDWEKAADEVKKSRKGGKVIACTTSEFADDDVLKRFADTVVRLQDTSAETFCSFMKWVSNCIFLIGFGLPPKAEVDPKTRRYPIYLLLDTSASMAGQPIEAARMGLKCLLSDLLSDPHALETCWLSIITFDETAKVLVPLTAIDELNLPNLESSISHSRSLGGALSLLLRYHDRELVKTTSDDKGDYKPLVFIMTDGNPTDFWEQAAGEMKERRLGNMIACSTGPNADEAVLKRITEAVIRLQDCSAGTLGAFFAWNDDSIIDGSSDSEPVNIPSLPPLN